MIETEGHVAVKKIKYCGNCNPDIHPKYIRHVVERIAAGTGHDTLVIVDGCTRQCLTKSKDAYPGRTIISLNAGELIMTNEEPHGEKE